MQLTAIQQFIKTEFPQVNIVIEFAGDRSSVIRQPVHESLLRPGRTISGPAQMMVADIALYVAILAEIGESGIQAVTSNMNLTFLSRPSSEADLIGRCKLIRVGKRLVTGEVLLYSAGEIEPVAHTVGTYSIPPIR